MKSVQDVCRTENAFKIDHGGMVNEHKLIQTNLMDELCKLQMGSSPAFSDKMSNFWQEEERCSNAVVGNKRETSQMIELDTNNCTELNFHKELERIKFQVPQPRPSKHKILLQSGQFMQDSNTMMDVHNCFSSLTVLQDLKAQFKTMNSTINNWAEESLKINNEIETIKTALFMLRLHVARSAIVVQSELQIKNKYSDLNLLHSCNSVQRFNSTMMACSNDVMILQEEESNDEMECLLTQNNNLNSEVLSCPDVQTLYCGPESKEKISVEHFPLARRLSLSSFELEHTDEEIKYLDIILQLVTDKQSSSTIQFKFDDLVNLLVMQDVKLLESSNTNIRPHDTEQPLSSHKLTSIPSVPLPLTNIICKQHLIADVMMADDEMQKYYQVDDLEMNCGRSTDEQVQLLKSEKTYLQSNQNDVACATVHSKEEVFHQTNNYYKQCRKVKLFWKTLFPFKSECNIKSHSLTRNNEQFTERSALNLRKESMTEKVKNTEDSCTSYRVQIYNSQPVVLNSEEAMIVDSEYRKEISSMHNMELLIEVSKVSSDVQFIIELGNHEETKKLINIDDSVNSRENDNQPLDVQCSTSAAYQVKTNFEKCIFVTLQEVPQADFTISSKEMPLCLKRTHKTQLDEVVPVNKLDSKTQSDINKDANKFSHTEAISVPLQDDSPHLDTTSGFNSPEKQDLQEALPMQRTEKDLAEPPEAEMSSIVVSILGQVNSESILIGWETADRTNISAFEVLVNGKRKQVINNEKKGTTIINSLNLSQSFTITLHALTSENKKRGVGTVNFEAHPTLLASKC